MKIHSILDIQIDTLLPEGPGSATVSGKPCRVWNGLPGERVKGRLTGKRRFWDAVAVEILEPSPSRIPPVEDHYLCCSPWQILREETELEWKRRLAAGVYRAGGVIGDEDLPEILSNPALRFGYRNKMEFSFTDAGSGASLAFFERTWKRKKAIDSCALAEPAIQETAQAVVEWLRRENIPAGILKSLLIRSNGSGQTLAALFVTAQDWAHHPPAKLPDCVLGFQIHYSDPRTPASVSHRRFWAEGSECLEASVRGTRLRFGLFSFFQVNIPLFARVLDDMDESVSDGKPILDFYGGIGAIALGLRSKASLRVVDSSPEAVRYAEENIRLNARPDAQALCASVEKVTELIRADETLILDPPRSGVHPDIIRRILFVKPCRVLYLSCNPVTHTRDLADLLPLYDLKLLRLYNFFPSSPHTEALAILEAKD